MTRRKHQERRGKIYELEYVLKLIRGNSESNVHGETVKFMPFHELIDGEMVPINIDSNCLRRLKNSNTIYCLRCGLVGKYFKLYKSTHSSTCLKLCGVIGNLEVAMTIDHIKPKVRGGKNNQNNYQVLCEMCNQAKNDRFICYKGHKTIEEVSVCPKCFAMENLFKSN